MSPDTAHYWRLILIALLLPLVSPGLKAQAPLSQRRVIIDTDIGDDIDDAFAVALALRSPELRIAAVVTAWGDTDKRLKIVNRLLHEVGREDILTAAGVLTDHKTPDQYPWGARYTAARPERSDGVALEAQLLQRYPGEITLIAIGPLTNLAALIDQDPAAFRQVREVVMMGGSIHAGYSDYGYGPAHGAQPEYNIFRDVAAARKVFQFGVPIRMLPLDATTMLKLDEFKRALLFTRSTPLTDSLALLYLLWDHPTPTLFDPMAVAATVDPSVCPATPLHIDIEDNGLTVDRPDLPPNASACLTPHVDQFFRMYMTRVR